MIYSGGGEKGGGEIPCLFCAAAGMFILKDHAVMCYHIHR